MTALLFSLGDGAHAKEESNRRASTLLVKRM
jgi:hypothetical protein